METRILKCLALLTLLTIYPLLLHAQPGRFTAGLAAGLNFTELEGREITDYFGPNIGLTGAARLTKHWQLGMELLYSQNGEYILPAFYPALNYGTIRLHHLEVPVHIDLLVGVFKRENFFDWNIQFGFAYSRLLGHYAETNFGMKVSDLVIYDDRDNWLLQFGTTYFFTPHIGWNLRASLPVQASLGWTLASRITLVI